MRKILYTLLTLFWCTASFAQQPDPIDLTEIDKPSPPKEVKDTSVRIFTKIDKMPEFPGGEGEMNRYIRDNFKYPAQALKKGIGGKVVTRFTVDRDGSIIDVIVTRGIGGGCDEEALRLVKGMPRWKPGVQNGRPVKVFYTLPLTFNPGR